MPSDALVQPTGIHHVRLTITDIHRSIAFYRQLFGADPVFDFSDKVDDPDVRNDPDQLYAGAGFSLGDQLLGLRPVADAGDTFESTRVGLDHISISLGSTADLRAAQQRLDDAGIEHGELKELAGFSLGIVSLQDPDNINLELTAPLDS